MKKYAIYDSQTLELIDKKVFDRKHDAEVYFEENAMDYDYYEIKEVDGFALQPI